MFTIFNHNMEWEPPLPSGYNDSHRAFLQAFMSRGTLTFEESKPIIAAILHAQRGGRDGDEVDPETITEAQFQKLISQVRDAVSPLDYSVTSTYHQVSKQRIYALVNVHSDPSTQLATSHTPDEISFIKRMLDAMFETHNTPRMEVMAIDDGQARKLGRVPKNNNQDDDADGEALQPNSDKGLSHGQVEKLLPSLVKEGWFEKSADGFYSLSARSLMELQSWMQSAYNDPDSEWQRIKNCQACKNIVTVGQRCSNRDCTIRLHDICSETFWRTQRGKKCPKCDTAWTGKNFVGERAVTETASFQKSRRARGVRRSDVVAAIMNPEDDDEEEDEEDNDGEPGRAESDDSDE